MPPPLNGVPPPPHVFGSVPSQVAPIPWTHAHTWQWMTPQTSLSPSAPREIVNTFHKKMPLKSNYARRDRFTHNRNAMYVQRNNFYRKDKSMARFGKSQDYQSQFYRTAYFSNSLTSGYTTPANKAVINHMTVCLPTHPVPSSPSAIANNRSSEETEDQDVRIVLPNIFKYFKYFIDLLQVVSNPITNFQEEVVVKKKNKQLKWNREDAERALKAENEYKIVQAQSLIIKFPDPDLNKDIVKLFHPGIQTVHFQSPSRPRYCFIQMADDVNIDEAIKDLEKIKFGVGYLKVERKPLQDEDNPMPEDINPYVLYLGNLPNNIKVKELKSKFPSARVDVGYSYKMRNTR